MGIKKPEWRFSNGRNVRIASVNGYVRAAIVPEYHFGRRTGYSVMVEKSMHGTLKQARKAANMFLIDWLK